jgi:hypothetical protein
MLASKRKALEGLDVCCPVFSEVGIGLLWKGKQRKYRSVEHGTSIRTKKTHLESE